MGGGSPTILVHRGPRVDFWKKELSGLKKKKGGVGGNGGGILATPGQVGHSRQRSGTASKQKFSLSRILRND